MTERIRTGFFQEAPDSRIRQHNGNLPSPEDSGGPDGFAYETTAFRQIYQADPVLRKRLRPNSSRELTVLGRRVVMDVDEFGCRTVVGQPLIGDKTLAVYGCSCTYGYAINANETFCSLLQGMLPTWRVENHGVPGYGTTHNLLQLQRNIRWGAADYVTFCWIPDHLLRNVAQISCIQRMFGQPGRKSTYPRAYLNSNGDLEIGRVDVPRPDLKGIDFAAFEPDLYYLDLICFNLFKRACDLVRQTGGTFFVTSLLGHLPRNLSQQLHDGDIPLVNASLDGREYTNLPDDHHPNARANSLYAKAIREYLDWRPPT
jgi:hypothetical protein